MCGGRVLNGGGVDDPSIVGKLNHPGVGILYRTDTWRRLEDCMVSVIGCVGVVVCVGVLVTDVGV